MLVHKLFRPLILCLLVGCADGSMTEEPEPAVPVEPDPPTATPPDPLEGIDGEYAVRIDPVSYVCGGVSYEEPVYHAIANVVEQANPAKFDLLARGASGFTDFTHWSAGRDGSGFFEDEYSFEWEITPGYPPAVFTSNVTGSATGGSLAFLNHWIAGWYDAADVFHTECDITYDVIGFRRYPAWSGDPRPGIDGQWRVRHEMLEDSFGDLEEPRDGVIDTVVQNADGSSFDLKGTRINLKNAPRAPDGSVAFAEWRNGSFLQLSGFVENDQIDLVLTWDWYDPVGGGLIRHVKDRYAGKPRFEPHQTGVAEPPTGAFNAELAQTLDSCDGVLDIRRYVIEALPADDGQILLWVAGLKPPPFTPNLDGAFGFDFDRQDGWHFKYRIDGSIDGDAIVFAMHAEALWPDTGAVYCAAEYAAAGFKRYRNLFPPEP